jgi:fructose-1,6-bisphosphatase/inositol monophosphatase family enzyme
MRAAELLEPIRRLHERIRDSVVSALERSDLEELSRVAKDGEGDTIYAVDRVSEEGILDFFSELSLEKPVILIAEGLENHGRAVIPEDASEEEAAFRILMDPIDGTRGLMYQKRSAWILTGVAPNRGPETTLADIELAVQTEIPLVKQHLSDTLWAVAGEGARAERHDRLKAESRPLSLSPSRARSIEHGFAMISRFFPGVREELAAIDEEIVRGALGPPREGKAQCFEDQYISSGGQLYELLSGHDRFVADLRPLLSPLAATRGFPLGICAHPYDLATELIARELGVLVTDERGRRLSCPLDLESNVAWVGYANEAIRAQIEPLLRAALIRRGLL